MGKNDLDDLNKFLSPFSDDIKERVYWLREFVWKQFPECNELIYDNYNALAIGWSISDKLGGTFCSIAVGRTSKNVHFGFYWGSKIPDPKKLLLGKGNQYRYVLVDTTNDFPAGYITKLLRDAYKYSDEKIKDADRVVQGVTITKSISPKKRALKKDKKNPRSKK